MKYICTNPFPNPQGKPIVVEDHKDESGKVTLKQSHVTLDGVVRKDHIHKGAIFSIGTASEFKDLAPAEKFLVAQLATAKKIAEATTQTVERVNKEVAHEKALAERDAARDKKADPMQAIADALAGLPDMIAAAVSAAVNKPAK